MALNVFIFLFLGQKRQKNGFDRALQLDLNAILQKLLLAKQNEIVCFFLKATKRNKHQRQVDRSFQQQNHNPHSDR